jgi:hypothetical protein
MEIVFSGRSHFVSLFLSKALGREIDATVASMGHDNNGITT